MRVLVHDLEVREWSQEELNTEMAPSCGSTVLPRECGSEGEGARKF